MLTAIAFVILMLFAGGAVDYIRYTTTRAELQAATDSAVLAASSLSQTRPPVDVAQEYFDSNFDPTRTDLVNVQFDTRVITNSATSRAIESTATAELPTIFLQMIRFLPGAGEFDSIPINVESQAVENVQALEVALVLDYSRSMLGPKIANLEVAASQFIDSLFDQSNPNQLSMSIVPFSTNVNLGPEIAETLNVAAVFDGTPPKYCVFYEDEDFNSERITETRDPVGQSSVVVNDRDDILSRDRCGEVEMLLNSQSRADLKDVVTNVTLARATDSHIGMMWGAKALSPTMRGFTGGDFSDRPMAYDDDVLKILVMMTDGNVFPVIDEDGVFDQAKTGQQFIDVCNDAKMNNVLVYTIGFEITAGSTADLQLQECASNVSQYFLVEGLDIQAAFDGIAASIRALRIVD